MSIRTPIGRVRGLGSAKSGTEHFWHQRLTAIANVFLVSAFVIIVVSLLGSSHARVHQILGSPFVAIVMLLMVGSVSYHMKLGMQIIIEDYVHDEKWKFASIIANNFFAIAVAAACAFAVLKISFGV
ncbi:MAG TPA: succinate dehydrogenase, hydrophobic membrane anchor protein [Casimicrobiaceae bacterium]|nr:succinate dehydrogenase, hydrophobic membrane anchor protein [Casimicrobiaceae bacterium]